MEDKKYSSSGPEDSHDFMEWEEDSGIERPGAGEGGTSSVDPNPVSGCLNSQPSSSGYIGQKRKSHFSSPLATKMSRNIWNEEQQQEAHLSVNETNLNNTCEVAPVSQMMLAGSHELSSSFTSDNKSAASVSGCIDSSDLNVSAPAIDNTSTTAYQFGTFHSSRDLLVKEKILLNLEAYELLSHAKGKSFYCNICYSKWDDEENLRSHLISHALGGKSAARKDFSI